MEKKENKKKRQLPSHLTKCIIYNKNQHLRHVAKVRRLVNEKC